MKIKLYVRLRKRVLASTAFKQPFVCVLPLFEERILAALRKYA